MVVCSSGPMNLAQAGLDAHPKPKNHDEAICNMNGEWETLSVNSREDESQDARNCLGEYHCQRDLLMWEPVPMPLLPPPAPN